MEPLRKLTKSTGQYRSARISTETKPIVSRGIRSRSQIKYPITATIIAAIPTDVLFTMIVTLEGGVAGTLGRAERRKDQ
jgi:hypothetical protein